MPTRTKPARIPSVRPAAPGEDPLRGRLVAGLLAAIAESGYAALTISDVVRHARVSKRTFYEHFADKDACFVEAYEAMSARTVEAIGASLDPAKPWQEQIAAALGIYAQALEVSPRLTRTFLLEIHAAGPRALEARSRVHRRFAQALVDLAAAGRATQPGVRALSQTMALGLVGGINEMMLGALESERRTGVRDAMGTAAELVAAVIGPPYAV